MSRLFSWVPVCEAYKKNAEGMTSMLAMEIERWLQRGSLLDTDAQRIAQRLKSMRQAYGFQEFFILGEGWVVWDLPVTRSSARTMTWWF